MKLFLFLDDWFLDSKIDMVRRFPSAVPVSVPDAHRLARMSIVRDEGTKSYHAVGKEREDDKLPALYQGVDGLRWEKFRGPIKIRFSDRPENNKISLPVSFPFEQGLFYDKWDEVSARRYKMLLWPYSKGMQGGPGLIACSPDGIDWKINPQYAWTRNPDGSDTNNNMFYNPFKKNWVIVCRKQNLDRRAAIVESNDLRHWTEPRVILQPDVSDPPFLQFYGMAASLYEDEYFLGIVQLHNVPMQEINPWSEGRVKMHGTVDTELVYSYDGECWLRSVRKPIIPRTDPGLYGSAAIYPHSIVPAPDGGIYIYSIGTLQDHSVTSVPEGYRSAEALMLHALRHDGFAFLEPVGGWGTFITKTLIPKENQLMVNYQAPVGKILVQVTDSGRKPLLGYSFDDCIPLKGDAVYGEVRWKKHANLSILIGKPIRLEFRLFDARMYAFRLNCDLWYGYWPKTEVPRI